MIVVGAYPESFEGNGGDGITPLTELTEFLNQMVPASAALHLLPFYPSAGDHGFAPNDWTAIHTRFGTWADIRSLAKSRKLIVDAIYNHVGLEHRFVREFFNYPVTGSAKIFAYDSDYSEISPKSPRGGSVLRPHTIAEQTWYVWQTYSDSSVDINLDHPEVVAAIRQHLEHLSMHGVWGVRLDAPAYYAKVLGEQQRHHSKAYRLVRWIVDAARDHRLEVLAQVDCDEFGLDYLPEKLGYSSPIVDYSFSAYLALALLSEDSVGLAKHLQVTSGFRTLRAPRTHDGILLRSRLFTADARDQLVSLAQSHRLAVRVIDETPYELNCSLPFLCSLGVSQEDAQARIELAISLSAVIPGWCYLYLPFLLGYTPELDSPGEPDPRSLNRKIIPQTFLRNFLGSARADALRTLLREIEHCRESIASYWKHISVEAGNTQPSLLSINYAGGDRLRYTANFNTRESFRIEHDQERPLIARRYEKGVLGPLGFCVTRA